MTAAERHIIVAWCERVAELWAAGDIERAEHWATVIFSGIDGQDFVDVNDAEF